MHCSFMLIKTKKVAEISVDDYLMHYKTQQPHSYRPTLNDFKSISINTFTLRTLVLDCIHTNKVSNSVRPTRATVKSAVADH